VALPTVNATAHAFGHYLTHPYPSQSKTLAGDLAISLERILLGFAIGTIIGVAIGAAMSVNQFIRPHPALAARRNRPPQSRT
jgi:ABC-type nitrate/sulfonate/bicarbonate transport system permease component